MNPPEFDDGYRLGLRDGAFEESERWKGSSKLFFGLGLAIGAAAAAVLCTAAKYAF